MPTEGRLQIGEVADAVGLSIRTIRHYDELGVVGPSARSVGGFRLYTAADVERLLYVKQLKPLGFTLEEVQVLVSLRDRALIGELDDDGRDQLEVFAALAEERCTVLRRELAEAELVATDLRRAIAHGRPVAD
jgi:DNA-binding transcriptional MerR regulator